MKLDDDMHILLIKFLICT